MAIFTGFYRHVEQLDERGLEELQPLQLVGPRRPDTGEEEEEEEEEMALFRHRVRSKGN